MTSKCLRCAGVASLKRQDHAKGTLITRPSTRRNVINSSVTETSLTRASVLTAVLMPCLLDFIEILVNGYPNSVDLTGGEAMVRSEGQGLQPEFADHPLPS